MKEDDRDQSETAPALSTISVAVGQGRAQDISLAGTSITESVAKGKSLSLSQKHILAPAALSGSHT